MDENSELESEIEANNKLNVGNAASSDKRKVIVALRKKAKQVRSNKQARNAENFIGEQQNDN